MCAMLSPQKVFAQSVKEESATLIEAKIPTFDKDHLIRKKAMTSVLERRKSPLVNHVDAFLNASYKHKLDPYLLVSISGLESSFAKRMIPGTYNAYGWGSGKIGFSSWEDGIMTISKSLKEKYVNRGATTVPAIGRIYAASPTWAIRVTAFMNTFYKEEAKYKSLEAVL